MALLAANPNEIQVSVSGFDQAIYQRGHRAGDIEKVKANMQLLAKAKELTGADTTLKLVFHLYRYNHFDLVKMFAFCHQLNFLCVPVLGRLMEIDTIVDLVRNPEKVSADIKKVNSDLLVRVEEALEKTKHFSRPPCNLKEEMVAIDVKGNVLLCCATTADNENIIGNYLDKGLNDIQNLRRAHSKCGPCMELNVPGYYNSQLMGLID